MLKPPWVAGVVSAVLYIYTIYASFPSVSLPTSDPAFARACQNPHRLGWDQQFHGGDRSASNLRTK